MTAAHDQLITHAALLWQIEPARLAGRCRTRLATEARQAVAAVLRRRGYAFTEIGRLLKRDHTTIMHAVEAAERRAAEDRHYSHQLESLATMNNDMAGMYSALLTQAQRAAERDRLLGLRSLVDEIYREYVSAHDLCLAQGNEVGARRSRIRVRALGEALSQVDIALGNVEQELQEHEAA